MKPFADSIWQNRDDAKPLLGCVEKSESMGTSLDDRFIRTLVELITEVCNISWKDRDITARCLKSAIGENVRSYLEAYLNGNLEILAKTMNREFGIKEKVDYKHAVHAKFNSIIKRIQRFDGVAVDSKK